LVPKISNERREVDAYTIIEFFILVVITDKGIMQDAMASK
jgi:hypothetical protein